MLEHARRGAPTNGRRRVYGALLSVLLLVPMLPAAQGARSLEVDVLLAEGRGAESRADVETIRSAARSADAHTARVAIRAIGRLGQPALIPDLVPALRYPLPETRAEAANAIGQAAQGWRSGGAAARGTDPTSLLALLTTRLSEEEDATVRAVLAETAGRLPYSTDGDSVRAEEALRMLASSDAVPDRLGAAKGLNALIRRLGGRRAPDPLTVAALRSLAGVRDEADQAPRPTPDSVRDVRVRRLAVEALTSARAADTAVIQHAAVDPDPQVRRLAMRAAALSAMDDGTLAAGLGDASPIVRLEALAAIGARGGDAACTSPLAALADTDVHVALQAIDLLGACGTWPQTALVLEDISKDAAGNAPRTWHRAAHALLALAHAAPERTRVVLGPFIASARGPARVYAARAAGIVGDRATLRALAADAVPAAAATAIDALARRHDDDDETLFVGALAGRPQVVRAAAAALKVSRQPTIAIAALRAALARLKASSEPGALEAADAVIATLAALDAAPAADKPTAAAAIVPERLRRLAAPRARIQIKDVGVIELALITTEAPATVLRFAELAESGYYDGLTFHRVVPNTLAQGGSPGADDQVGSPGPPFRNEVGTWPHVRGTLGMATDGVHEGRGQFFVNLVDNPQFDHERTVFGQILNGIEVIDRILEGDVIERIEIMP